MDTTVSRLVRRRFSQKMKKQICVFFYFFTLHGKKKNFGRSFFGRIFGAQFYLRFYLTLTSWKGVLSDLYKLKSKILIHACTRTAHVYLNVTLTSGRWHWICFQELRLLRKVSRWQLIQNSVPSAIVWRQRDIWIKPQNLKRIQRANHVREMSEIKRLII